MSYTIPPTVTVRLSLTTPTPEHVLEGVEAPLHSTAERIYRALHGVALATAQAKAQALTVSQVVIHQAVELVALHLGISRVTFYKHLATLKRLGLVAARGHVSSYGGLARKDGTLFAVALKTGHRARLRYDDLKHKWRDLAGDIASGTRTAWSVLQGLQSKDSKEREISQAQLVAWAVNPGSIDKTPVTSDCKGTVREYVYSLDLLIGTHPKQRAETVNQYAQALAAGYGDSTNLNFWRWLLWRALNSERDGIPMLYRLQNALTRLQADIEEWQGLKKPGALLITRMRMNNIYPET